MKTLFGALMLASAARALQPVVPLPPETVLTPPVQASMTLSPQSEPMGSQQPIPPKPLPAATAVPALPQGMPGDPSLASDTHYAGGALTPTAATAPAAPSPQPKAPSEGNAWMQSQRQIADISAMEASGELTAAQGAAFRAELKSIRSSIGLKKGADSSKLTRAQKKAFADRMAVQADMIRQARSKP